MQKSLPYLLLFILALLIFDGMTDFAGFEMHLGDEDFDGPLGTLFGALLAGGGIVIGTLVMLFVGVVLAVVFAGVSIVAIAALVLGACAILIAVSPLLLPLLIPIGIVWLLMRRKTPRQPALKESPA